MISLDAKSQVKHLHKSYDSPEDKLYNIQHHVDYKNNQSGCLYGSHSLS